MTLSLELGDWAYSPNEYPEREYAVFLFLNRDACKVKNVNCPWPLAYRIPTGRQTLLLLARGILCGYTMYPLIPCQRESGRFPLGETYENPLRHRGYRKIHEGTVGFWSFSVAQQLHINLCNLPKKEGIYSVKESTMTQRKAENLFFDRPSLERLASL
jgi:hypothetical protein